MTDLRSFDEDSWQPMILSVEIPEDRDVLKALRAQGRIWQTHDLLARQVLDLIKIRMPGAPGEVQEQAARQILAQEHYGRWIHYPWSGRLVHVLPPEDFHALRLSRNFYKITPEEQARLAQLTIGVVGLSAGAAVARTLALEGVGGHLKLADFDRLELSNMNRIYAGVHDLGLRKSVVIARQLMEINPYLRLTLYQSGITHDNIDDFLGSHSPGVDMVIEECDALPIKVLVRERARARKVPVIMETSDRGMLDVERYDLESDRAILHGRLGTLDSHALEHMPVAARLAVAAQMAGPDTVSARLAASAMEIGHSIVTWPQLGSDVTLGSASVTAAARRIGLGQPLVSGRRYVDLDAMLARAPEPVASVALPRPVPRLARAVAPHRSASAGACSELARFVVAHAAMAPSGGNAQPWRFHAQGTRLWLSMDRARARNLLSVADRPVLLGLGAAVENIHIAAAAQGYRVELRTFPGPASREVIAELALTPGPGAKLGELGELAALIEPLRQRATNRKPGSGERLTCLELRRLERAAESRGARLELVADGQALAALAGIVGESDRIRYLCGPLHREMYGELRWNPSEASKRRDGLDVATLELSPAEVTALRLAARPDVARFLREQSGGAAMRDASRVLLETASAVGVLSVTCDTAESWLAAGRAMQRVWIEATDMGLGFQPAGTLLYMLHMLDAPVGVMFRPQERAALLAQKQHLDEHFPLSSQRTAVMMFRLARAPRPAVRSLRRPVDDILLAGAPPFWATQASAIQ